MTIKIPEKEFKACLGVFILTGLLTSSAMAKPPLASSAAATASSRPQPVPPSPFVTANPAITAISLAPVESGIDAKMVRPAQTSPFLTFKHMTLHIFRRGMGAAAEFFVVVEWKAAKEYHLVWESGQKMEASLPAEGLRELPIKGPLTLVTISTIGPRGDRVREEIKILIADWPNVIKTATVARPKPFSFTLGLGITSISYNQDGATALSEIALTPKASYTRFSLFNSRWDGNISAFYSYPVTTNRPGVKLSYFGFNYRAGYNIPIAPSSPWTAIISLGGYYTTTVATGDTIGFDNQSGPQILPSFRYRLNSQNSIGGYVKYAALISTFGVTVGGSEIAIGADYGHLLKSGNRVSGSLDFATLSAKDPSGTSASNQAVSLGLNYAW